jgi:molecular chaperone Hsp31 and glyoxalase 3
VAFPDATDSGMSVSVGYLPGRMTELMGEGLTTTFEGLKLMNKKPDDSTHVYKELISGASPQAADTLGALVVKELERRG